MAKKFTYLVIGAGSIGERHIRNLRALGREVVVCDKSAGIRNRAKKLFSNINVYLDLREALKLSPDIAMICTPSNAHLQPASMAAKAGCHLFIEKPLAHNLVGVAKLLKLIKSKKIVTLVGCNMRFQYGIKRVKRLSESLGKIYSLRCEFGQYLPDWRPNRDYTKTYSAHKKLGGGIVLDAIHELDYLLYLMDKKPVEISAFMTNSRALKIDVEDKAAILLRFNDDSLGEISVDYLNRRYHRCCQVIAQQGSIYWDENDRLIKIYMNKDKRWRIEKEPKNSDFNQSYIEEILHLEDSIVRNKETVNSVAQAVKTLRIALAAKRSADTSKHIKIDWFK